MENLRMNRVAVSKSSFEEADNHVSFYLKKTPLERLNYACSIIYTIFNSSPEKKVDRAVFSARKYA
jgi:hypothetical protein